ncbi:MAG: 6-carboxytetrahydropterin synthase [Acidobacteriota bacterium]|nr:6-carboxytetrahydropterin synthase [Acidobacteriota bacterium]
MSHYTLRIRSRFEAAHHLTSYHGEAEPVHGHSWLVEVELATDELGPEGMAYDFVEVKQALEALVAPFHHQHINTVPPFDELSPTTEHIARHLFHRLEEALPQAPLSQLTVWEGPDCSATYRP